jgi:hypothetical protein
MGRGELITILGGAAVALPLVAHVAATRSLLEDPRLLTAPTPMQRAWKINARRWRSDMMPTAQRHRLHVLRTLDLRASGLRSDV